MNSHNSLYPLEWIAFADRDWRRTQVLLNEDDAEGAAFHLQQALEKYLKGFLLAKGWRLKKTHELETLLAEAVKYDSSLKSFQQLCEKISTYYFTERYPQSLDSGTTTEEVEQDMSEADQLRKILSKL